MRKKATEQGADFCPSVWVKQPPFTTVVRRAPPAAAQPDASPKDGNPAKQEPRRGCARRRRHCRSPRRGSSPGRRGTFLPCESRAVPSHAAPSIMPSRPHMAVLGQNPLARAGPHGNIRRKGQRNQGGQGQRKRACPLRPERGVPPSAAHVAQMPGRAGELQASVAARAMGAPAPRAARPHGRIQAYGTRPAASVRVRAAMASRGHLQGRARHAVAGRHGRRPGALPACLRVPSQVCGGGSPWKRQGPGRPGAAGARARPRGVLVAPQPGKAHACLEVARGGDALPAACAVPCHGRLCGCSALPPRSEDHPSGTLPKSRLRARSGILHRPFRCLTEIISTASQAPGVN